MKPLGLITRTGLNKLSVTIDKSVINLNFDSLDDDLEIGDTYLLYFMAQASKGCILIYGSPKGHLNYILSGEFDGSHDFVKTIIANLN